MFDGEYCWACHSSSWAPLFDVAVSDRVWSYVVCDVCGLARLDPTPEPQAAAALYDESYFRADAADGPTGGYFDYAADEALHRRNGRARLRRMTRSGFPADGPILDLGCAHGYFLSEAQRGGRQVVAVEPSNYARRHAEAVLRQPVFKRVEDVAPASTLAAVSICQVLEHTSAPDETVSQCVKRLQPGGLLYLETWDRGSLVARAMGRRWSQVTPPSVITLLDRPSTRRMLESAGLRVESIKATGKTVSFGLVAGLIGEKVPQVSSVTASLTKRPKLAGLGIRYALGDLMTVTARRM